MKTKKSLMCKECPVCADHKTDWLYGTNFVKKSLAVFCLNLFGTFLAWVAYFFLSVVLSEWGLK